MGEVLGLHHVQLAMPGGQEDIARAFYTGVLGLIEEPKPAHLTTRGGVWFRGGTLRLHLGVDADFRPARKAHPALLVRGLAELSARCAAAGFPPAADEPLEGFDRLYVFDPFGNRVELLEPRPRDAIGPPDTDLREAVPTDSDFVFNVLRAAIGPYVELEWGWDDARERARHVERWGRHRVRVIVAGGADAGYLSTAIYDQPTSEYPSGLYLHQLMILPAFQSRGIGSACLRRVQAEARELGIPLRFRVLRVNPRALAFYVAAGCRIVGESDSHISLQWSGEATG